ncbi:MAG: argininosuccinate lyase [Thermodesulfobacteriota bacterium]
MTNKSKPWKGRFTQETDKQVEAFTASITFDKRLYKYDIAGSVAHAKMLAKIGILSRIELKSIVDGLGKIEKEIEEGSFIFSIALEDIHMNIEARLVEIIGDVGGKLHTARSRNDQVALDIRLYLRNEINTISGETKALIKALIAMAKKYIDVIMPGYTHLQRAQPVLIAHHLLAYCEMLKRDQQRLKECSTRVNVLPLGAGALAGTTFPIDRDYVAALLDFPEVAENSMDAVSDRDFCIEFCSVASILMMHLSRLSEELILWSTQEFGFIEMSDAFTTGSSIMPQKKNPDVTELIRGKTGRVYGNLINLLTLMKGLPLAYNKDMQEDKIPLFDTVDTLKACLGILTPLIKEIKVDSVAAKEATRKGFLAATDIADYLVGKGISFRKAHEIVGKAVRLALEKDKDLDDLTLEEWHVLSDKIDRDVSEWSSIEGTIERRVTKGGTAKKVVLKRLKELEKEMQG